METNSQTTDTPDVLVEPKTIGWLTLMVLGLVWLDYWIHGVIVSSLSEIVLFSTGTVILAISNFIPQFKYNERYTTYLIVYHVAISILLIWLVPLNSGFLFLWGLLLFISDHYYQFKGFLTSLILLFGVVILSIYYQEPSLSWNAITSILPQLVVVISVTMVLIQVVSGSSQRRAKLAEKITQAQYEHQRLIALINSMTEAVIAVNQSGKITIYNAAAMELLDTNLSLTDKDISDFIRLRDSGGKEVSLMKIAATSRNLSQRTDLVMLVGDTDQINLEINISRTAINSAFAKQQGYTFMLRDITKQKSLDVERDEFISVVSHELRTPIAIAEANLSVAQLVANKPNADKAQIITTIDKAHHQVLFLSDMVNDLATLSRAERTDKELEAEVFSIAEIIDELEKTYGPQADKKGLKLVIEADQDMPCIKSSRLYVKEIIQNFVTNAIKYTEKGQVTITAKAIDQKNFKISVSDTGIGIAKAEQDKVFEKFWRSEDPYTRQASGTGLGLYITAKLAKRIGAIIGMNSVLKSGTTFSITLPISEPQEDQ